MKRKTKRTIAALTVLLSALIITAGREYLLPHPEPIHHIERVGDLLYTIDLDRDVFKRGESIRVRAAVQNLGTRTLGYTIGSSSCPSDVNIDIAYAKSSKEVGLGFEKHACTTDLGYGSLAPGQSTGNEAVFSTESIQGDDSLPAPAGVYHVRFDLSPFEGDFPSLSEPTPSASDAPPTGSSFPIRIR